MAALPVYVHVPKLYAQLGLSLAWLGLAMLLLRFADALVDPWLGRLTDRVRSRKAFIAWSCLPLAAGALITFGSVGASVLSLQARVLTGLALTYFGFSAITIAYHAWGGEWTEHPHERTRITTWREAAGLIGVLVASALPVILTERSGARAGYAMFGFVLVATLVVGTAITLYGTRVTQAPHAVVPATPVFAVLQNPAFVRLLITFALNGIAAAIPATLFLFFAEDVVRAGDWQAQFLIAYFISGALATPGWLMLSRRIGKRRAWGLSMLLAVATFVWAYFLGPGDRVGFMAVCVLSGLALGADLTLPPSMLADVIAQDDQGRGGAGGYFGIWTMVSKLNLALAAGVALPALAWLGYSPGSGLNVGALSVSYALLPCALKIVALISLYFVEDRV